MADNIKIPAIPTKEVSFKKGTLTFKVMSGCAYCPDLNGFTGGDWVPARLKTMEGAPVWVRLEGGELVIEQLVNGLVEKSTGRWVGGECEEIARLRVSQ